ncbi:MAG: transglycosylase SLT domain-containing protein, partial [Deltaproteobacteria bacterium]|nr:transglycosylase SLT domain-containing protein [Deltaproteobacteria bacterium]
DLYDPDVNIMLGATYLQMLEKNFFGKLKDEENRQVLAIASYNAGPTRVKRAVVGSRDIDAMAPEDVVELVKDRAPDETKDYVVRVRGRMALYRKL